MVADSDGVLFGDHSKKVQRIVRGRAARQNAFERKFVLDEIERADMKNNGRPLSR